ncbi:MAG: S8 family serine peptidase, partial [Eubacterium sp.]|nr:S8 family serine peptidase [Eubacterium sp.]
MLIICMVPQAAFAEGEGAGSSGAGASAAQDVLIGDDTPADADEAAAEEQAEDPAEGQAGEQAGAPADGQKGSLAEDQEAASAEDAAPADADNPVEPQAEELAESQADNPAEASSENPADETAEVPSGESEDGLHVGPAPERHFDMSIIPTKKSVKTGNVIVMYKNGSVSTEAPDKAGKAMAKGVRTASGFGRIMSGIDKEGKAEATNTLGDQKRILEKPLGKNYTIQDTMIFRSKAGSLSKGANAEEKDVVVSIVSSDKYSPDKLARLLEGQADIEFAEPDYTCYALGSGTGSGDPMASSNWHLDAIGSETIQEAAAESGNGAPVIVVLDTGVDYKHEELENTMWKNPGIKGLRGTYGYDFCYQDDDPMDENGHGTHCAGIIAAEIDNDLGIKGIAGKNDIKIMALRFLDEEGSGELSSAISAYCYIVRAMDAGVNIKAVSNSWGVDVISDIFDKVIDMAGDRGALSLFASGNESLDNDLNPSSPANSGSPYAIAVDALNSDMEIASYSSYGRKSTDVAAPGTNIISSVSYNNYMPNVYDKDRLAETTLYYGEFNENTTVTDGKVTPSVGTDVSGASNEGAVRAFGESVMLQSTADGEDGHMSLSLAEPSTMNGGEGAKSLKWSIRNVKAGDMYMLYFPYKKKTGTHYNGSNLNIVFRGESGAEFSGLVLFGDVSHQGIDVDGLNAYIDDSPFNGVDQEGFLPVAYAGGPLADEWIGSGINGRGAAFVNNAEGYGIGLLYAAATDDDITFYIDSIGIAKDDAPADLFGKYDLYSGTSMATPVVAGALGLIASAEPEGCSALLLKAKLMACVTKTDSLADKVSTGGYLDLSKYDPSDPLPGIMYTEVDFPKNTVALWGRDFGEAKGTVSYEYPVSGGGGTIPAGDLSWDTSSIIIKNAKALIGHDATLTVTTASGKEMQAAFYMVSGEREYTLRAKTPALYSAFDWRMGSAHIAGADIKAGGASTVTTALLDDGEYIPVYGADDLYFSGSNGEIMLLEASEEEGEEEDYNEDMDSYKASARDNDAAANSGTDEVETMEFSSMGSSPLDAIAASPNYTKWVELEKMAGLAEPNLELVRMGTPVYYGGIIYELLAVRFTGMEYILLLGYDRTAEEGKEWSILYDSSSSSGPVPTFNTGAVTGAMNGKLYIAGGMDEDTDNDRLFTTDMMCWDLNAAKPVWTKAASLPADLAGGHLVTQNGKMYYIMGFTGLMEENRSVYAFNGSAWTKMNADIPIAIHTLNGYDASVGISKDGLVIAGISTDGGGDTFVYKTADGLKASQRIEQLNYTVNGKTIESVAFGTSVGDKQYALLQEVDLASFDDVGKLYEIPVEKPGV